MTTLLVILHSHLGRYSQSLDRLLFMQRAYIPSGLCTVRRERFHSLISEVEKSPDSEVSLWMVYILVAGD